MGSLVSDFPGDDKLEYELKTAQALHERVQTDLNAECQVAQLLTKADEIMGNCLARMNKALGFNTWGMSIYGIGGLMMLIFNGFISSDAWGGGG